MTGVERIKKGIEDIFLTTENDRSSLQIMIYNFLRDSTHEVSCGQFVPRIGFDDKENVTLSYFLKEGGQYFEMVLSEERSIHIEPISLAYMEECLVSQIVDEIRYSIKYRPFHAGEDKGDRYRSDLIFEKKEIIRNVLDLRKKLAIAQILSVHFFELDAYFPTKERQMYATIADKEREDLSHLLSVTSAIMATTGESRIGDIDFEF